MDDYMCNDPASGGNASIDRLRGCKMGPRDVSGEFKPAGQETLPSLTT